MATDRTEQILNEKLLLLVEVARWCDSSRTCIDGTREAVHVSTVRRWARVGQAGHRLGTVTVDGTVYTSEQEVFRWIADVVKAKEKKKQDRRSRVMSAA